MPSILNLKFKGNKSFVAFSNLGDTDSLTKTWKVCTKVASFLEQGARLENLSWRLWHLQNLMVDSDNAKSKREFKKLSKHMGDKLDKEKGRSIEELEAPDFRRNHSSEMLRQRAEEKERNREASQNAKPGTIKRTHFTFSVEQPALGAASLEPVQKPDLKPSAQFRDATAAALKRGRPTTRSAATTTAPSSSSSANVDASIDQQQSLYSPSNAPHDLHVSVPKPVSNNFDYNSMTNQSQPTSLHFPSIFNDSFGPSALLYPTPTLTNSMNYGEGVGMGVGAASADGFSIARPTIELALDDLLSNADAAESPEPWIMNESAQQQQQLPKQSQAIQTSFDMDVPMPLATAPAMRMDDGENDGDYESNASSSEDEQSAPAPAPPAPAPLPTSTRSTAASRRSAVIKDSVTTRSGTSTPVVRPTLTIKTQPSSSSRPGATATNPPASRGGNNSAPGGVKAECSNCGATHTPLWRRGLNDELNCNACGLYCKLHKRPRPKNMRNNHGEGRSQSSSTTTSSVAPTSRQEAAESISSNNTTTNTNSNNNTSAPATAQCYNCHTTATPLWRKDDVGKTVCNACGLYFKLHGSARPISMKSDVIRKRSRHDARRMSSSGGPDSPSASPGASRRASPLPETSPVLAPDSTTQMNYDYGTDSDFHSSASELMGALGGEHHQGGLYGSTNSLASSSSVSAGNGGNVFNPFPGPYHPDYLTQNYVQHQPPNDALPFASVEAADMQESLTSELGRTAKRRRMSVDSASEPPSSAVSYSSYTDGASSSRSSSMDFNFGFYQANYPVLRSSAAAQAQNAFWHPPMMPQAIMDSPQMFHPPMLPSAGEDSTMDYLHSSATTSSPSSSSLLGSGVTGTNGPSNNNKGIGAVHGPGSASSSVVQDDDSLFATYLHPPMLAHDESTPSASGSVSFNSPRMPHPPVFASEGMYYENSGMQSY